MNVITENIVRLFKKWSGNEPIDISPLPSSGSYRKYFRCFDGSSYAMGVFNEDVKENKAFLSFTRHFLSKGLPVPEIYGQSADDTTYLLQDLGDQTLLTWLFENNSQVEDTSRAREMYEQVLLQLIKFQVDGGKGLDYSLCYPRDAFDKQSILWDLNYFKYHFLKLTRILFDEQKLENDFHAFADFLLQADTVYFLYRDFQSRNIMIHENKPYFIDYQGGRKGALAYDVASLLFESKTGLPASLRTHLLNFYTSNAAESYGITSQTFIKFYYPYALVRILQAMGAYGFRGLYEQKALFIQSIPKGIKNLTYIYEKVKNVLDLPELYRCFDQIIHKTELKEKTLAGTDKLHVEIFSFSYKKQKPVDISGNGGGFMFDCRSLPNPGRYAQYKTQTGKDAPVIAFLEEKTEVSDFLGTSFELVDKAVENYLERKFNHLMVSFGCTGGQHRSVYSAEQLKKHLNQKYDLSVSITHMEVKDD